MRRWREFLFVTVAGLAIYCINIISVAQNTTYQYAMELWGYGRELLNVLYPFVFTAPFCVLFFYEKHSSYEQFISHRTPRGAYWRKRILTMTGLAALAMFLVSIGGFVCAEIIAPHWRTTLAEYDARMAERFCGALQMENPVAYALLLSCWRAVLAGIYLLFSAVVSVVAKNIFIALTSAFLYSVLENFILAVLGASEISICTSFYPDRLSGEAVTFQGLAAGPLILLFVTAAVGVFGKVREKIAG